MYMLFDILVHKLSFLVNTWHISVNSGRSAPLWYALGHGAWPQSRASMATPVHVLPPNCGVLHFRSLIWLPPPQVTLQGCHCSHWNHSPSTTHAPRSVNHVTWERRSDVDRKQQAQTEASESAEEKAEDTRYMSVPGWKEFKKQKQKGKRRYQSCLQSKTEKYDVCTDIKQ